MSFLRFLHSASRSSSFTQSAAMYDLTSSSAFKLSSLVSSVLMRSLAYSNRPWISSHGCRTLMSVTWCRSAARSTICASMLLLRSSRAPITSGMTTLAALSRLMSAQLFSALCFLVAGTGYVLWPHLGHDVLQATFWNRPSILLFISSRYVLGCSDRNLVFITSDADDSGRWWLPVVVWSLLKHRENAHRSAGAVAAGRFGLPVAALHAPPPMRTNSFSWHFAEVSATCARGHYYRTIMPYALAVSEGLLK